MKIIRAILLLICFFYTLPSLMAQCPMCKASAEANIREGGTKALGLNAGILYLFLAPYLLVLIIGGIFYYRNVWKKREQEFPQAC